ncbi:tetratricopeptide repeat protein [Leptolyngbya iicbica]|nr:tetratricopeptide repeat protein [Leptolyngbya sp. LK]
MSLPTFWRKRKKVGKPLLGKLVSLFLVLVTWGVMEGAIAAPYSPLKQGIEALQQQHYEAALQHFAAAAESGQTVGDAYSYQCLTFLMLNKPQQATEHCQAALKVDAEHPQARFYQGLAHYRLGQFEAAIAALNHHLAAHPDDSRAYYNCGLAKFAQGDVRGAIAQYHQALTYAAALTTMEMSNLYNDLGVAYWATDAMPEAKFALDQAVAMDTQDTRAYFNRGCICHHLGHYQAALQNFEQVLALDPHHASTYLNRGIVQQQLGNLSAAQQDYQTAAEQFRQQGDLTHAQQAQLRWHQLQKSPAAVG